MIRILTIAWTVWLEMIRRKDLYVLLILLLALLFVLMSLNIFGLGAVVRYVADVGLLFAWIFSIVLSVSMAARHLPQEEAKGTIYPLLAKPITRAELIVGKWLGTWTAPAVATLLFYVMIFSTVIVRGGTFDRVCLAQAILLHITVLSCVSAIALAMSTRMTYGAAASMAYVFIAAAFAITPRVPELVVQEKGFSVNALLALYYGLPHFELFDLRQRVVHDWGPAPWGVVLQVFAYGVLWTAILLLVSWLSYRKKRFQRGSAG
jgi:ABC-type transport system involved in multi-copper enzyme maturation permease subunit